MVSRIPTLVLTTTVAVLIWLYAEARNLAPPARIELTIELQAPEGRDDLIFQMQPGSNVFQVEIEGATNRLDAVKRELEAGLLRLTAGMYGLPITTGNHSLPIRDIMAKYLSRRGVSIQDIEPKVFAFTIDSWLDISLEVAAGSLGDVEVDGPIRFEPARVNVRIAARLGSQLDLASLRLVAVADPAQLRALEEGRQHQITARLTLPNVPSAADRRISQPSVQMTLTVKSTREEFTKTSVPIKIALTPVDQEQYIVTLVEPFISEVRLSGPSDLIAGVREGRIKVIGYVDFTSNDLAADVSQMPVTFPRLPPGLTVVSGPFTASVTIQKRLAPAGEPDASPQEMQ